MGVYIKDREVPKNCSSCFYAIHCDKCIFKTGIKAEGMIHYIGKKPKDCPISEVKEDYVE